MNNQSMKEKLNLIKRNNEVISGMQLEMNRMDEKFKLIKSRLLLYNL